MPGGHPSRPARRALALAAAGLAVTACSQQLPGPANSTTPSSAPGSASASAHADSAARPAAPLTGLPEASAAQAAKPAVALVVAGPAPQGLGSADVVFEEMTTPVRYIAVYQSRQSAAVGPVTSTQPTDGQVLSVLHPVIGYDGAATPFFFKVLAKTKVNDAGYLGHPALYTSAAGGLTATPASLAQAFPGDGAPPPLFSYRGSGTGTANLATTGVSRPSSVTVTVPGAGTQLWTFDSRADRWGLSSGGPSVQAANLVIEKVPYRVITISRRRGVFVSSARVIGTGWAEVFSGKEPGGSGGTAATGSWSKPNIGDVTNYFDAGGSLMAFQPGPTWVILAPDGTQVQASGGQG